MRNIKAFADHLRESYDESDIRLGPIEPSTKVTELTKDQEEYRNLIFNRLEQKLNEKTIEGWTIVPGSPYGEYDSSFPSGTTFNAGINIPSATEGDDIIIFGPFLNDKDWFITVTATFDGDMNSDLESTDFCAYDIWQHMTGDLEEDSEFIIDMIRDIMPRMAEKIRRRNRSRGAFGRF